MPPSMVALSPPGPGGTAIPGVVFAPVSWASLRPLLLPHRPPCISLALPTHRRVPDNRVDPLRFHHLVESLATALAEQQPAAEVTRLLAPLEALALHRPFWEHTHEGLCVLAADGEATVFIVDEALPARARIGDHFHLTDLLRIAAAARELRILALTSRDARLLRLTPAGLETEPFPSSRLAGAESGRIARAAVVDQETSEPHRVRRALGSGGTLHGGAGDRRDDIRADTGRFFRAVADVMATDTADSPPLVLVALPELAAAYRAVARDPRLLPDTIPVDPHAATPAALRAAIEPLLGEARRRTVTMALERFGAARAHGHGSADVADVARAAVAGRVELLLVEAGRQVSGRLDRDTGAVSFTTAGGAADPSLRGERAADDEDLVGAIAATVVLHGGALVAVDRLDMPDDTGLAAIERYRPAERASPMGSSA